MASKEILIISTTPPKPFSTYNMSSSPPLPSPGEVFKGKAPLLRTGSRATPIPQNAAASFTSTSSHLKLDNLQSVASIRSFGLGSEEDNLLHDKPKSTKPRSRKPAAEMEKELGEGKMAKNPRKPAAKKDDAAIDGTELKKPRKSRTKKADEEDGAVKGKAPRKSRIKKADGGGVADDTTQEKAVHKSKSKNADGDAQTKLPKTQITKTPASKDGASVPAKSKKHATTKVDPFVDSLNYGLVEAVKRRTNWTPPSHTAETASMNTPVPVDLLDGGLNSASSRRSEERSKGFQDLFSNFGFSKLGSSRGEKAVIDGAGTRKRKLIELVKTNLSASTTKPAQKTKAPKKKPRTITEQATSAYAEEDSNAVAPAPLLQYFSFETTDRVTSDGFKIPPKPRSRSPVKRAKGTAQAPILLSPESSLKQVGIQDFVFGTSSQLAREDSPTFLRDVHAAMQVSNEIDEDDPFASSPVQLRSKSKALSPMKRNLWSAAARDGRGRLLDVEMVDLAGSPAVVRQLHTAVGPKDTLRKPHQEDNEPWHDIEELLEAPTKASIVENSPKAIGPVEAAIRLEISSSPASSLKNAKSPAKSSTQSKVASSKVAKLPASKKPGKSKSLEKPDFAAYTMAQLTKEVASYHFKPVKSRDQMIALLEKCWEGKQRMALGTPATNLPLSPPKKGGKLTKEAPPSSQAQAGFPKRPRGRPRKDSSVTPSPRPRTKTASMANALSRARKAQKRAEVVDEISDSDTAPTLSPPRRHPSQIGTPPLPLPLSSSTSVDTRELSPASSQVRLFGYITTAVKNAPPSTDSTNPSWHEKILLYDPIILEDLAVWLNTGALEKAGWDGEVDAKEVKKWCESKSICCLWKENLRGGARSRH